MKPHRHHIHTRENRHKKEKQNCFHFTDLQSNNIPLTLQGHTMVSYNDLIYCFGGYNRTIEGTNEIHEYSKKENLWRILLPESKIIPSPRHYHSCSIYNDSMIIYGGYSQSNYFNDIFEFNLKTKEWKELKITKESTTRSYHQSVIFNDNLYLFGGKTSFSNYPNHMSIYDLKTNKYKIIDFEREIQRTAHSMTIDKRGIIYIFGGFSKHENKFDFFKRSSLDNKLIMDDLLIFDTEMEQFKIIKTFGEIPSIRSNIGYQTINENVYLFGGFDTRMNNLNTFFKFNYLEKKWKKLNLSGNLPKNGLYSISNIDDFHLFLFGGWTTTSLNRLFFTKIDETFIDLNILYNQNFNDVLFEF
eukprot:gene8940-889_t